MQRISHRAIAAAVSLALLVPALTHAADGRTAAEIQAEIDRLTAALEAQKQELAATQAASPADNATVASVATDTPQDTALGKVTVRARNRLEPLQEVPLSVGAADCAAANSCFCASSAAVRRSISAWISAALRPSAA